MYRLIKNQDSPGSMLPLSIDLYLNLMDTPMEPHARTVLDAALMLHTERGEADENGWPLMVLENSHSKNYARLMKVINELGDRYEEPGLGAGGKAHNATLCSLPVVIFTDGAPQDLDKDTLEAIKRSLQSHGLRDDAVSMQLLPWLTKTPVHLDDAVRRRELLTQMICSAREEDLVKKLGSPKIQRKTGYDRLITTAVRPEHDEMWPGDVRDVCGNIMHLRYINFALVSKTVATHTLLTRDDKSVDQVNAWTLDVQELVNRQGDYIRVVAGVPAKTSEAANMGESLFGKCQVRQFLRWASELEAPAANSALRIDVKRDDEDIPVKVALRFRVDGVKVGKIKIPLYAMDPAELPAIAATIVHAANNQARAMGLGRVEIRGIRDDMY